MVYTAGWSRRESILMSGASLRGRRVTKKRNNNQENVDALGFVSEEVSLRVYIDMHIHAHAH